MSLLETHLPAFAWPLKFCAAMTAGTWVASLVTGNVSQVDRVWTFLPTIYLAYFALLPLWPTSTTTISLVPFVPEELAKESLTFSPRALLMLGLAVIWMFRLSYNTYRRGLFSLKDEDYRWAVLRTQLPAWLFQVTNLVFIAGIQNVLLMLLGIPAYIAAVIQPHTSLELTDIALGFVALGVLLLEFTSDNQQFSYQTFKSATVRKDGTVYDPKKQWPGARLSWTSDDARRGFVTKGLWAYSRHPNFTCEQSFWWILTILPIVANDAPHLPAYHDIIPHVYIAFKHGTFADFISAYKTVLIGRFCQLWPLLPGVCLSILFVSSTIYTESITLNKYPKAYRAYKQRVAMFGWSALKALGHRLRGDKKKREIDALVYGAIKED